VARYHGANQSGGARPCPTRARPCPRSAALPQESLPACESQTRDNEKGDNREREEREREREREREKERSKGERAIGGERERERKREERERETEREEERERKRRKESGRGRGRGRGQRRRDGDLEIFPQLLLALLELLIIQAHPCQGTGKKPSKTLACKTLACARHGSQYSRLGSREALLVNSLTRTHMRA